MNKQYFRTMFCADRGKVYRVVNGLSTDTSIVTEQLINDAGTDLMSIVVVNLEKDCVVYVDLSESISSEFFEEITDLTPDVVEIPPADVLPEVPPVEETP